MKYVAFDDFFTVLGNKQRVRILQYLNETGSHCVSDICRDLHLEQSAVSHNMKRLVDCHFVEMEPAGKKRLYSINKVTVRPLLKLIDQHVSTYCAKGCSHWE
jgi:DNA-binding transcriptional ArsR family regulator